MTATFFMLDSLTFQDNFDRKQNKTVLPLFQRELPRRSAYYFLFPCGTPRSVSCRKPLHKYIIQDILKNVNRTIIQIFAFSSVNSHKNAKKKPKKDRRTVVCDSPLSTLPPSDQIGADLQPSRESQVMRPRPAARARWIASSRPNKSVSFLCESELNSTRPPFSAILRRKMGAG